MSPRIAPPLVIHLNQSIPSKTGNNWKPKAIANPPSSIREVSKKVARYSAARLNNNIANLATNNSLFHVGLLSIYGL